MYDSKYHYDNNFFHNPIIGDDFYIYQLGELYSNEKTAFKEHRQRCDEISLILSGRGYFYSDGKKIDVQPGDCFISFRDELHYIENQNGEPLRFYFCGFTAKSQRAEKIINRIKAFGIHRIECSDAKNILSAMIDDTWQCAPMSSEMTDARLTELAITLLRHITTGENCRIGCEFNAKHPPLVYQITRYLETHIYEPDAIGRLEHEFNYNYRFLSELFSRSMQKTLRSYFSELRMERAKEMLDSGKSVTETAEQLGYSSLHPFSRAYKNHFKICPSKNKER